MTYPVNPELLGKDPSGWLEGLGGSYFLLSRIEGGHSFLTLKDDTILSELQKTALEEVDASGLLAADRVNTGEDSLVYALFPHHIPIKLLSPYMLNTHGNDIKDALERAEGISSIPQDRLRQYLMQGNFQETDTNPMRLSPTFIEEYDKMRELGSVVIN